VRVKIANWMRRAADRMDRAGAVKRTGMSFTFAEHWGVIFHEDGAAGCPLWYYGDADYALAHQAPAPPDPGEVAWVTVGMLAPDGSVHVLGSADVAAAETSRRMTGTDVIPVPGARRPAHVPRWRVTLRAELDSFTSLPGPTYPDALYRVFGPPPP